MQVPIFLRKGSSEGMPARKVNGKPHRTSNGIILLMNGPGGFHFPTPGSDSAAPNGFLKKWGAIRREESAYRLQQSEFAHVIPSFRLRRF